MLAASFLLGTCMVARAQQSSGEASAAPSAGSIAIESDGVQAAAQGIVRAARATKDSQNTSSEALNESAEDADSSPESKGLRHFEKVANGIYRSGRLDRAGLEKLYDMGIRNILNLEGAEAFRQERKLLGEIESERKAAGKPERHIVSENVPMSISHPPGQDQIDLALSILSDPAKRPILVHCEHGSDRTGIVVAAYRAEIEKKMTISDAVQEAKSEHCCHWVIKGKDGLENYLNNYHRYRTEMPQKP
ncbi:MAG: tyrosine-protein phosphatase [Elusimicrobiota bacterium]